MNHKRFSFRKFALFLVSTVFLLLCVAPAHAYYFGDWSTDGYFKSQIGVFTETKPFNKPQFGGSNDNLSTAKQMFRWNINGQVSSSIGVKAEVLAAWEPNYPGEKGVFVTDRNGATVLMRNNYYNSFDWRELTIEWKPSYSHSFKFGRQIVNWGEAVSGRVIDQCNPDDSRSSAGFVNLEERYMPLWMLRGFHELYSLKTSIEWLVAPIWQANRYEHGRGVTGDTPVGNGKTTFTGPGLAYNLYSNNPSPRFSALRENRTNMIYGADYIISFGGTPSSILGAPYSTGYHGSDLITPGWQPGDPIRALTTAEMAANPYVTVSSTAGLDPNLRYSIFKETPTFLKTDYTDHNLKNTRWGIKTKSLLWDMELGLAFFQGPAHSPTTVYRNYSNFGVYPSVLAQSLYFQYVYPRYNTYGIYGNYQFPWAICMFEAAYQPDRQYVKELMNLGYNAARNHPIRLNQVEEIDQVTTLIGLSREQNIEWLNKYNVFSLRLQYTNTYFMENMDDIPSIATFYMHNERMTHNFLLSASTSYSYRKYSPSLTLMYYPEGAWYYSVGFNWIPEGFNSRLSINLGYTGYWATKDFVASLALYDKLDSATVGFQYSFY